MTQVTLDRSGSASFPDEPGSPGPGREASRPAPCGAPTRHLGLYAFDRGRTGPGPSARRGCPSTARGRGCVLHRSQVPLPLPAVKTPHENAPGRVDRDRLHVGEFHYKVNTSGMSHAIVIAMRCLGEILGARG